MPFVVVALDVSGVWIPRAQLPGQRPLAGSLAGQLASLRACMPACSFRWFTSPCITTFEIIYVAYQSRSII